MAAAAVPDMSPLRRSLSHQGKFALLVVAEVVAVAAVQELLLVPASRRYAR